MRDPIAEFIGYNRAFARRSPELLRYKIARMAAGPFGFFRGTFHLFARDILERIFDPLMPPAGERVELDLVGDIHNENFGAFEAADGVVHYDINDFDETTKGRFDFDVRRLATSQFLVARERGDGLECAVQAARVQAAIPARTHARAAGRVLGPSNPLAELADADQFCQRILSFALAYADLTVQDWMRFAARRQELDQCERWAEGD